MNKTTTRAPHLVTVNYVNVMGVGLMSAQFLQLTVDGNILLGVVGDPAISWVRAGGRVPKEIVHLYSAVCGYTGANGRKELSSLSTEEERALALFAAQPAKFFSSAQASRHAMKVLMCTSLGKATET